METGAYQIGPPPALRASIHNAPQMDQNVGSSSSSGKQRPILTIPHALSNPHAPTSSVSQETEKKHEGDSPTTAPNTLVSATQAQGSQAQQATHGHSQSVATTVVTRNLNRVSRISQAAPSERTRIVSGVDYHDWPQRPEPITAVLSIWQHTVWVFGPLGVVAGAGALGVFVCLHLDVSAAAWMVYIVAYFLLSFLFLGIMGHEMRIFSERKWRKILQKVGGEEGGMALQQQGQHTQGHDNGRLSADGRNYQIGEADETIATEAGESYGPMESGSNAHANKRQSVAFRSPDKPVSVIQYMCEKGDRDYRLLAIEILTLAPSLLTVTNQGIPGRTGILRAGLHVPRLRGRRKHISQPQNARASFTSFPAGPEGC